MKEFHDHSYNFNFLGHKRLSHKSCKEAEYGHNIVASAPVEIRIHSKKGPLNCKFKLKQNRKRITGTNKKDEKKNNFRCIKNKEGSKSPHNTSQFLIESYNKMKIEDNSISDNSDNLYSFDDSLFDIDTICIPGGSMIGIINYLPINTACLHKDILINGSNTDLILDDNKESSGDSERTTEISTASCLDSDDYSFL